ncbi:MAG: hypothetical protein HGB19_05680, partial [Chlorobiales bacterium]|nr:hypothetical protein [Chlorobiales bacterium]
MNKTVFSRVLFGLTFALLLGVSSPANAQYFSFGKNKVQYTEFNWKYVQSDHFDVYFTEGGEYLAKFTADVAEAAYKTMRRDFRYEVNNRVAIMVFKSHNDFQQNNVVHEFLEEGIGGVTELYKNRVVLPFDGDYRKFRHVIHHELVHAVMNDMIFGGSVQSAIVNNIRIQIPLWLSEGLAEYQSLEWDTNSDMFINDAIQNSYLPPIEGLNGYFAYRGGQSVFRYVSETYGREKIGEIMQRLKATRSVEAAFRGAIGLSIEELSERWVRDLKVQYWPEIARREDINAVMKKLTDHKEDGSNYNTSPSISPQGDKFAFITDRSGYFDIYLGSTINPDEFKRLVSGQRSRDFEELKILTPGVTWSPDGKKIALATKAGESDAIMLIDVEEGDTEKLTFALDGIFSVSWSPDGNRLAFIGNQDFKSDIFVYNLQTKELINLTNDVFSDSDPAWSKDGKKLFFSSDRRTNVAVTRRSMGIADGEYESIPATEDVLNMRQHDYSQVDLYELTVESGKMRRLTATEAIEEASPICSPDNQKLLFISDKNGIYNVYELNLNDPGLDNQENPSPKMRPVTNVLSGIRQISLSADGTKLVGVGLDYAGFDIYMLRLPFERKLKPEYLDENGNLLATPWGKALVQIQTTKFADVTQGMITKRPFVVLRGPKDPSAGGAISAASPDSTAKTDTVKAVTAGKPEAQPPQREPGLDLKNFVFDKNFAPFTEHEAETEEKKKSLAEKKKEEDIRDEKGDYKVKPYKLSFSPDIIYGNAQYDALFGASGSALFSFSDLMGNHQIALFTNLQID